jgi:flagellar hook assembly protein FlgD
LKCFPNPFNPTTNIAFSLSEPGDVSIQIFNARGQAVRKLFEGALQAGEHVRFWDGTQDNGKALPSGVYLVRLKTKSGSSAVKILMLK